MPTFLDIITLADERSESSVSITLRTSPVASESERLKLEFKNAVREADRQLESAGVAQADRGHVRRCLESVTDGEFWAHLSEGMAVYANTELAREFRVMNHLPDRVAVGDRFDVGPLLRSLAFSHAGYVLALSEGSVRLAELSPDTGIAEVALDLPDDLHTVLEYTQNDGQADLPRAQGTTGAKVEQRKYCRIVHDAVRAVIGEHGHPLVLVASQDLEPVYREINTYRDLLAEGVGANPSSRDLGALEADARHLLDRHHDDTLTQWREDFGTHLNDGRASADLATIARAASRGAVAELLFDLEDATEGWIDDDGTIIAASEAGPVTFALLDEIAVRVLRTGGTVRAVRRPDLPGDSPAAAVLRFAVPE